LPWASIKKGVKEQTSGCNCGNDVDKYTEGNRQQWCATFSSWVFNEAGTPFTEQTNQKNGELTKLEKSANGSIKTAPGTTKKKLSHNTSAHKLAM
jgi:hypothetical protein